MRYLVFAIFVLMSPSGAAADSSRQVIVRQVVTVKFVHGADTCNLMPGGVVSRIKSDPGDTDVLVDYTPALTPSAGECRDGVFITTTEIARQLFETR